MELFKATSIRTVSPPSPQPAPDKTSGSPPAEGQTPAAPRAADRGALSDRGASRFGGYDAPMARVVVRRQVLVRGRRRYIRYVLVRYRFPPQPYRPQPTPPAPKPAPAIGPTPPAPKPTPVIGPTPPAPKPEPTPATPKPEPTAGPTPPAPKPDPLQGGGGGEPDRAAKLDRIRGLLDTKGQEAFAKLGPKLDEKDLKTGKTTLDHMVELAEKGVDNQLLRNGITKGNILSELAQELADPGIIHQSNRGTCAATTVQYYMATNHPAEYARVVAGLMNGGQVEMASGKTFLRDQDAVAADSSTRNNIDRMFQTSATDRSELGDYRNDSDTHVTGARGMSQEDVTNLMNDLTSGKDGQFQTITGNGQDVLDRIARSTARGVEVPVGMKWAVSGRDAGHELLVTKIENGQVHLRNPWGQIERGQAYNGPQRQVLNGKGDIVMSLQEFQRNLITASLS